MPNTECVNIGGEMAPKADVSPIEHEWVKNLYLEAKERNIEFKRAEEIQHEYTEV